MKIGIQDCVSANKIAVSYRYLEYIGVSPMRFNDLIMVNHKLVQEDTGNAYTT